MEWAPEEFEEIWREFGIVEKAKRILRQAKAACHFTPHCLRHTYASLLLAQGVSVAYVQEQ